MVARGDPYQWQIEGTARCIVDGLGRNDLDWVVCYQSKVGPLAWLEPSTVDELDRAGRDRVPVVVVPIAFVSEHSETLVELDATYRDHARAAGIPAYHRVPALGNPPGLHRGACRAGARCPETRCRRRLRRRRAPMPCGSSRLPAGGALMADDLYTWLRALHVIAVIAWMAGMLYLPRLYVYHADAEPGSELSETLKVMERRLLRIIINPAMVASFGFGGVLLAQPGVVDWSGDIWIYVKLALVVLLAAFHGLARPLAPRLHRRPQPPQRALLPPGERGADARHDRYCHHGHRQAVLSRRGWMNDERASRGPVQHRDRGIDRAGRRVGGPAYRRSADPAREPRSAARAQGIPGARELPAGPREREREDRAPRHARDRPRAPAPCWSAAASTSCR